MFELAGNERSPLEALSKIRFGGRTFGVENIVTFGTTRVSLLRNNPNRVYALLINEGDSDIRVSIDGNVAIASGFILAASGGLIEISWETDGETVGYELYGISSGVANTVRTHEVIRL